MRGAAILVRACAFAGLVVLGCASSAQKEQEAAAKRIDEICALPKEQREAELERLKKESGLVLHCGKD